MSKLRPDITIFGINSFVPQPIKVDQAMQQTFGSRGSRSRLTSDSTFLEIYIDYSSKLRFYREY